MSGRVSLAQQAAALVTQGHADGGGCVEPQIEERLDPEAPPLVSQPALERLGAGVRLHHRAVETLALERTDWLLGQAPLVPPAGKFMIPERKATWQAVPDDGCAPRQRPPVK